MANPSSLKPFQKGDDPRRNTKGRPKGSKNMSTLIKEALQRKVSDGKSLEDHLVDTIIHKAVVKGDFSTIKLLWAYLDGKPQKNIVENSTPRTYGMKVVTEEEDRRIETLFTPKDPGKSAYE
jgi:hypothetical protein